ncbi:Uncharacterised protein [Vibrio cholerae]|nr:Uncharacterised protein [Vibrio cholerae]
METHHPLQRVMCLNGRYYGSTNLAQQKSAKYHLD